MGMKIQEVEPAYDCIEPAYDCNSISDIGTVIICAGSMGQNGVVLVPDLIAVIIEHRLTLE